MSLPGDITFPFPDLDFIFIQGGRFSMGDETDDLEQVCHPTHQVEISSFYLCKYQVTQRLWRCVMGENPSFFKGDKRPLENVSWHHVQDFIKKLNSNKEVQDCLHKLDPPGVTFRLPTEAEWEFAARGGIFSEGYFYPGSDDLDQVGWYNGNSGYKTHNVGLLRPNELGIYDMSGNVWEWCEDDWHNDYNGAPADGSAWINTVKGGIWCVFRGGCCFDDAWLCRSAYRFDGSPGGQRRAFGFRLAFDLQSVPSRPCP